MKKTLLTAVLTATLVAPLFADGTNVFTDDKSRVSYAIGMSVGHNFQARGVEVDPDVFLRGLKDTLSGGTTLLTPQEQQDTLRAFGNALAAKQQKMREEAAAKNKADGEAFLAGNKDQPGVVTLPSGLQYKVITEGTGPLPKPSDRVAVNYRGTLIDGKEFDRSPPGHPAQFPVGGVIPGWSEALTHMKVGSKWQLFIPSNLAYGENGPPNIGPNSTLIFEVELLSAQAQQAPSAFGSTAHVPMTSDIIKVPSLEEIKKGAKVETIKSQDVPPPQPAAPAKP